MKQVILFISFIVSYSFGVFFGVSQSVYKWMLGLPRVLPGQRWHLFGVGEVLILHVEKPLIFYEVADDGRHWHCKINDFQHNAILMLSDSDILGMLKREEKFEENENVIKFPNKNDE